MLPAIENMPYGTHLPALMYALARTTGPVIEVGSGLFSTPVLHGYCFGGWRKLTTVESDPLWREWMQERFTADWHQIVPAIPDGEFDVALIDGAPASSRGPTIEALRSRCRLLVIHDTNDPGMGLDLSGFKWRRVWRDLAPWTDVVSDSVEL